MSLASSTVHTAAIGERALALIRELYPICRSITGEGVRRTLRRIQQEIPLQLVEVPSGTAVFDWTVPPEWNIRDAYIQDASGRKVVDFQQCSLHVMSYSTPVQSRFSLAELKAHLHTVPGHPEWIPFRTSYYNQNWGFCLSGRQLQSLADGEYDVRIDSTLDSKGSLTYGECLIHGATDGEVVITTHVCHPSLCNDNLSGISVATLLAQALAERSLRYTYRLLFIPTTIGSITWLATHPEVIPRIRHGLVLTGVGDKGALRYKKSRHGATTIDRVMAHVLHHSGKEFSLAEFSPYGYDERQFCSPGFDLPVGSLMRTPYGQYPEYHTSGDNIEFVRAESLEGTYRACLQAIDILEGDATYRSTNPHCEPQLGKRGLYRAIAGQQDKQTRELNLLWVLNLSDGRHSLLDIAERSGLPFPGIREAATVLLDCGLLELLQGPA
ncbi:MAG: DUF4910 domain-containing protein [Nitrospiraceae bacterium]